MDGCSLSFDVNLPVLTWTVVPKGSEIRVGIDRDEDGAFDLDELLAGSNPADPTSVPSRPARSPSTAVRTNPF